jgi:hypothetical protein
MSCDLPHHHVYARIARSGIHGVGVKAIRTIKKGTYIFRGGHQPARLDQPEDGRKFAARTQEIV